jgi:hypothetical protein
MKLISALVYLLFGYIIAAMLSDHVFANLSLTHWENIWTYIWIILWPFMLAWTFFYWACILILVVVAFVWLKDRFFP